jgi:hypothetical protein
MVLTTHDSGFGGFLIRDVADDLAKALQRTIVVPQSGHRHAGQKFRPVLAKPPAFLFDASQPIGAGKV